MTAVYTPSSQGPPQASRWSRAFMRSAAGRASAERGGGACSPTAVAAAVVVAVGAAYANSFAGAFVYDDVHEIAANPSLRTLLPPWDAMFGGNILPARPLPYLTFAVNVALGGTHVAGFHAVNLVVHMTAAAALFHVVRLSLASPRLAGRFGPRAMPLAFFTAVIWGVHPLTTQAVTYVYQRIESLTGMLMLLALAAFAAAAARGFPAGLLAGCVACSAAAMASKENAVVLPCVVLAYDWCLVADGVADLWSRRGLYAALAATWFVLAAQVATQAPAYQELRSLPHPPIGYALTQAGVILHYLRLSAWPVGQCLDYGWPIETDWRRIVPAVAVVLAALVAGVVGLIRRRPWSAPVALFFLTLAPTSSIMPVDAVAAEHRMYLPLAAVAALAVPGMATVWDRLAGRSRTAAARMPPGFAAACLAVAVGLGLATLRRNAVYARPAGVWIEALARNPANPRPPWMLAVCCDLADDFPAAEALADRSVALDPGSVVYRELVQSRIGRGDLEGAERLARRAVATKTAACGPTARHTLLAVSDLITVLQNRADPAAGDLAARMLGSFVTDLGPDHEAALQAATILSARATHAGEPSEGERLARGVIATLGRNPALPGRFHRAAAEALAAAVFAQGRGAEAEELLRDAVAALSAATGRRRTDVSMLRLALASQLAAVGRVAEAVAELEVAVSALERSAGPGHPATESARRRLRSLQGQTAPAGPSGP